MAYLEARQNLVFILVESKQIFLLYNKKNFGYNLKN